MPVIFGVLTTVAAFAPMFFAPGGPGQIFAAIGKVVTFCLVVSVIESQRWLPPPLGLIRPAHPPPLADPQRQPPR